jgi:hypothetical protein
LELQRQVARNRAVHEALGDPVTVAGKVAGNAAPADHDLDDPVRWGVRWGEPGIHRILPTEGVPSPGPGLPRWVNGAAPVRPLPSWVPLRVRVGWWWLEWRHRFGHAWDALRGRDCDR